MTAQTLDFEEIDDLDPTPAPAPALTLPAPGKKYGIRLSIETPKLLDAKTMLDFFTTLCKENFGEHIKVGLDTRKMSTSKNASRNSGDNAVRSSHEDKMRVIAEALPGKPFSQLDVATVLDISQSSVSRTLAKGVKDGQLVKFKDKDFKQVWMIKLPEWGEGGEGEKRLREEMKKWMASTEVDTEALMEELRSSKNLQDLMSKLKSKAPEVVGKGNKKHFAGMTDWEADDEADESGDPEIETVGVDKAVKLTKAEKQRQEEMKELELRLRRLKAEAVAQLSHPMNELMHAIEEMDDDLDEDKLRDMVKARAKAAVEAKAKAKAKAKVEEEEDYLEEEDD